MIAREWRCLCPLRHREGFLTHLERTGIREARDTPGFCGHLLLEGAGKSRPSAASGCVDICLVTLWDSWKAVRAFAGEDMERAVLYPGDERYEIMPDRRVRHYEVLEAQLEGEALDTPA